jgi:hypothetical protein
MGLAPRKNSVFAVSSANPERRVRVHKLRHGHLWVDCTAAREIDEAARRRDPSVPASLVSRALAGGPYARITGEEGIIYQDEGGRLYRQMQKDTINSFAQVWSAEQKSLLAGRVGLSLPPGAKRLTRSAQAETDEHELSRSWWVYALKAKRGDSILPIVGCFSIVYQTETVVVVKDGWAFWAFDNQEKLILRGNWNSEPTAIISGVMRLLFHMVSASDEAINRPRFHDGFISIRKSQSAARFGAERWDGTLHDLYERRDISGFIVAERFEVISLEATIGHVEQCGRLLLAEVL